MSKKRSKKGTENAVMPKETPLRPALGKKKRKKKNTFSSKKETEIKTELELALALHSTTGDWSSWRVKG